MSTEISKLLSDIDFLLGEASEIETIINTSNSIHEDNKTSLEAIQKIRIALTAIVALLKTRGESIDKKMLEDGATEISFLCINLTSIKESLLRGP